MAEADPDRGNDHEPNWVEDARRHGLEVERVAGAFVITQPDDQPLWKGGEAADREKAVQERDDRGVAHPAANGR